MNIIPFQFDAQEIRVAQDDDGNPWFNANDVCRVLGFGNPRQALESHADTEDVQKMDTLSAGGKQQSNHINESGLYALIMGSAKPDAKRFKRWVTSEVLPSIRKTGKYEAPRSMPKTLLPVDREFRAAIRMAKAVGLTGNRAILSANQLVARMTGTDCLALLETQQLVAETQVQHFTASDLGARIGVSGRQFNKTLQEMGFQFGIRDAKGRGGWSPTKKGGPFAVLVDTGKRRPDGTMIQQLRWLGTILDEMTTGEEKKAL